MLTRYATQLVDFAFDVAQQGANVVADSEFNVAWLFVGVVAVAAYRAFFGQFGVVRSY